MPRGPIEDENMVGTSLTVRPDQREWLRRTRNASRRVRDLIDEAMRREGALRDTEEGGG